MQKFSYGVVAILGLSFWFFLGFPFAHHNESYMWAVDIARANFVDSFLHKMRPVANLRPLGQCIAWLSFKVSNGATYPAQLFNFTVAILAWLVLFVAVKEKRILSVVALICGGVLFSGYIYLFHLHGVFYSPLLLLIALTFLMYESDPPGVKLTTVFVLTLVISLFHPYALLVYLASTFGYLLEHRRSLTKRHYVTMLVFAVTALVLMKFLVFVHGDGVALSPGGMLSGLVSSYRMVEVNTAVTIVSSLLTLGTVMSMQLSVRSRTIAGICAAVVLLLLWLSGLPLIIAWVGVCLIKMILMRKWWIASLLFATSLFPAPAPTGSPTYTVFVLMACTAATAYGWSSLEKSPRFPGNAVALSSAMLAVAVVGALRLGVYVPAVSRLANPLLAEREKTVQLEHIVRWLLDSGYHDYSLIYKTDATNPSESNNAIDRTYRPPAGQVHLDEYLNSLRPSTPQNPLGKRLILCFGNEKFEHGEPVYVVESAHAGPAVVYLPQGEH